MKGEILIKKVWKKFLYAGALVMLLGLVCSVAFADGNYVGLGPNNVYQWGITVKKEWKDDVPEEAKKPVQIRIEYLDYGQDYDPEWNQTTVTLNESNDWTYKTKYNWFTQALNEVSVGGVELDKSEYELENVREDVHWGYSEYVFVNRMRQPKYNIEYHWLLEQEDGTFGDKDKEVGDTIDRHSVHNIRDEYKSYHAGDTVQEPVGSKYSPVPVLGTVRHMSYANFNYVFMGWFEDETFAEQITYPFKMPANDKVIWGKWIRASKNDEQEKYPVVYEWKGLPNKSELPEGTDLPELPTDSTQYVTGARVNRDNNFRQGTEYAINGKQYSFSGWKIRGSAILAGELYMPRGGLYLVGEWQPSYPVSYEWTGLPKSDNLPQLPPERQYFPAGFTSAYYDSQVRVNAGENGDYNEESYPYYIEGLKLQIDGKWYEFSGWSVAEDDSRTVRLTVDEYGRYNDFDMPANKVVLSGTWRPIDAYRVTYQWAGLKPEQEVQIDNDILPGEKAHEVGTTVDVEKPGSSSVEIDGQDYVFVGWRHGNTMDSEAYGDTFKMPAEDVVIYGFWEPGERHTVTYEWKGLPNPDTLPSLSWDNPRPEIKSYSNITWDNGTETLVDDYWGQGGYLAGEKITPPSSVKPDNYNGGTVYTPGYIWKYTDDSGAEHQYQFSGWTEVQPDGEKPVEFYTEYTYTDQYVGWIDIWYFDMPNRNVKFVGEWTEMENPHNVKYEWTYADSNPINICNISTGKPLNVPAEATYSKGATVTTDTTYTSSTAGKVGDQVYIFSGWTEDGDGNPVGETFEMPDSDVTIKGKWVPAVSYYVRWYVVNDPDNTDPSTLQWPKDRLRSSRNPENPVPGGYGIAYCMPNTTVTVDANNIPNGMRVMSAEYVKDTLKHTYLPDYNPGSKTVTVVNGGEEIKLYCTPDTHYTVTYVDGVDNAVVFEDQVYPNLPYGTVTPSFVNSSAQRIATDIPERKGYRFTGWKPEVEPLVYKDATYVAQWEADGEEPTFYTVTYQDGLGGALFADQVNPDLEYGTLTPDFKAATGVATEMRDGKVIPKRDGYEFVAWTPKVSESVVADAVYVATWAPITPPTWYNLTINYLEAGTRRVLSDAVNASLTAGATYNYTSPTIAGCTLVDIAQAVVSGTMPASDVTVDVFYAPEAAYTLTINYVDRETGEAVAPVHTETLKEGDSYEQASPVVEGYVLADVTQSTISGTMPAEDVVVTVYYVRVPQTGTYTVRHMYYRNNDVLEGDVTRRYTGTVGEIIRFTSDLREPSYNGRYYDYQGYLSSTEPFELTADVARGAGQGFTLVYSRSTGGGGGSDPDPTPPPSRPDPEPVTPDPEPVTPEPEPEPVTPEPEPEPVTPEPEPQPEPEPEPEPTPVLPDPNDPDSPDEITIEEDGVPKTYIKVWDPEKEEYVYILDEDVPLADQTPKTGDDSRTALWAALAGVSLAGAAAFTLAEKKHRKR